jgi:alkanesulfonate monooxygenase SsuD/methylene tetrahydromethanopterin reductase-like flavin-dependent oxidoreductase (luciferase family)
MHYGLYTPCYGEYANPRRMIELAQYAEQAGWDGLFISDHILWNSPDPQDVADPWILLAAIATVTQRIRLGIIATPIARRRPWKIAREALTLDQLSGGRMILGAGIGGDWIGEYSVFGEPTDDKLHAAQLDEGLQIIAGLCSGELFSYEGMHYQINQTQFLPKPIQPHIPIWVAGGWPRKRPIERAARWDGIVPFGHTGPLTPADIRAMDTAIQQQRTQTAPFEIVCYTSAVSTDSMATPTTIAEYAEAGATWWLDGIDMNLQQPLNALIERVRRGPPVY